MKKLICCMSIALTCGLLACHQVPQTGSVAVSGCGGFATLGKVAVMHYVQDSAEYCAAERLQWSYRAADRTLEVLHTRKPENCAARLVLSVRKIEDGSYLLTETNTSTVSARCMCCFDTYCELPDIAGDSVSLVLDSLVYKLSTARDSGVFVLDTSPLMFCHGAR
jgi:hypothetical protein